MCKLRYLIIVSLLFIQAASAELICYWDFDGDIKDSCNSGCEPDVYGHISFADGIVGKCLDFSDTGNNAVIFRGSANLVNGLNAFTVSFWYKGSLFDNPAWASIISKNGEGNQGWQLRFNNLEGGGCFTVRGLDKGSGNCGGYAPIADGKWHYITGVFDGTFISLYVDGVLEEIVENTGHCGLTKSPIVIGAKIARGKKEPYAFSKGMIDELCIYDQALDKKQIKKLNKHDNFVDQKFMDMYRQIGVYPIQLHRGGGIAQPENTLETFEWTWSKKVIPEADVRMTSDDIIVCFHDTDLKRICPQESAAVQKKGIGEMTLKEIRTLDVGRFRGKVGQKIPTLNEIFKAMSGRLKRFLFLDYKYIDMQRLARLVKEYGIEKQVIFTNKSHNLIMQYKKLVPEAQTLLWTGGTEKSIAKKLESIRMEGYQAITMLQLHYRTDKPDYILSDEFLLKVKDELEQQGIIFQILPWKIDDESVYKKLIGLGVRSFATDYPDALLPVYEDAFDLTGKGDIKKQKDKK